MFLGSIYRSAFREDGFRPFLFFGGEEVRGREGTVVEDHTIYRKIADFLLEIVHGVFGLDLVFGDVLGIDSSRDLGGGRGC